MPFFNYDKYTGKSQEKPEEKKSKGFFDYDKYTKSEEPKETKETTKSTFDTKKYAQTVEPTVRTDLISNEIRKRPFEFTKGLGNEVEKEKALDDAFRRLEHKGVVGDALVERPPYLERVREETSKAPSLLQPLMAPIAAIAEAPVMHAIRESLGTDKPEEEGYLPVKGAGKIAGQIIAPIGEALTVPGAQLGGGALYGKAGDILTRLAPRLGSSGLGRTAETAIKLGTEGGITGVGGELVINPDASGRELAESAAYGAAGSALLGGLGRGIGEGIQKGVGSLRSRLEGVQSAQMGAIDAAVRSDLPQTARRGLAKTDEKPLTLYRGQPADFSDLQRVDQSDIIDNILIGKGIFTTTDESVARSYGENVFSFEGPKDASRVFDLGNASKESLERIMPRSFFTRKNYGRTDFENYTELLQAGKNREAENALFESLAEKYLPDGVTWESVRNGRTAVDGNGPQIDEVRTKMSEDLQRAGFDFMKHKGGIRAGKNQKLHDVYIALNDNALVRRGPDAPTASIQPKPPAAAQAPKRGEKVEGERAYLRTLRNSGKLTDEVSEAIAQSGKGKYTKITNAGTLKKINNRIEKDATRVESELLNKKGKYTADDVTAGIRTIQELQKNGNVERAVTIAENLSKALTEAGQAIQAASIVNRLSPDGQFLYLVRRATAAGKTVTPEDAKVYTELAAVAQKGSTSKSDTSDFIDVLNRLKAGAEVSPEELKQATSILDEAQKYLKRPKSKPLTPELADVRKRDKVLSYLEKQAADARAQWNAKRNISFAAKLTEPDIVLLAKMGSYKLAKAGVKLADFTEDMVREFGEEIRPYISDIYDRAKTLVTGTSKHISEGKLQEAQEAFERLSKAVSTPERVAEKFIKEKAVRESDINHLRDLAKQLNDLTGADAQKADMKMQEILNKYTKSTAWEKIQTVRYLAMLLNTSTQAVNAISGPIMASTGYIADVFGTIIDVAMNKVLKTERTTTLYGSNPLRFMAGWFKNAGVGAKAGAKGVNPGGITGQHDIRGLTFKSMYNPFGLAERGLGAVSKGADYGTYKTVFDSELKKQAFLDAKNKRIKGKAERKAHIEKFLLDPPPEAIEQADKIGRGTTFQRTDSLGGKVANYANSAPSVLKPAIGAVFPFLRTPINIASTAVTLTPGGIIKGLYQLTKFSDASQRDAIRTLSLGLTGSGIGAIGYYLMNIGVITGANDSGNKDVDAIREQAGKGKYRFNTSALGRYLTAMLNGEGAEAAEKAAKYREGDKQFDYNKLQPLAFPLAIGASLGENKDERLGSRLLKAGEEAYGSLYGMSTLKGVQDVFQPSYGGTLGQKALGMPMRVAESFAKSFSPSFLAQEARRQDPVQRKTSYNDGLIPDVKDYFKSRTPGLSKSLPPNLTTLGLTKQNAPGIKGQYLNPFRSEQAAYSEAAKIISELIDRTGVEKLAPTAPDKKVSGKARDGGHHVEIEIPPKRYVQMQQEQGQEIIKRILALSPSLSDEEKTKRILDIYEEVKEKQRNKVKRELGIRVR